MHRLLPRWEDGRFEVEANSELLAQQEGRYVELVKQLQARNKATA
jgi:hypothetical protein